ncbi:hypothetical protein BDP27DRAFT_1422984 [Rhodocollybia butyracea]|uniref:Uncharacterized protein n=1 Tax=Rhodocollybia butyracea TaxID=206335 RepID=A0A9P5PKI2_9AGAR|nr:hypothetical protein BDP27DRAFT_1422984 [Rhodocollybia butyracea]
MCPSLEFLTLESFQFERNPGVEQIACQSSLLTLNIGGDRGNTLKIENGAWTNVTLPKLTKLNVKLPDLIDYTRHWETAYEADTSLSELKEVVKQSKCALQRVNVLMYARIYGQKAQLTLETAEKLFEDLPVKAEGSFVEDKLLLEWKVEMEETIDEQKRGRRERRCSGSVSSPMMFSKSEYV